MIEETVNNIISDPGEVAFVVHSNVQGPIRDLTFLQRALLFAELSMISYNDEAEARRAAKVAGFDDVTFYDHDGSQAFRFRNEFDCVIACRGTEPNEWNDIQADANAASVVAETVGKVHRGFKREVDDLWPMIETALMSNQQPLWFCGHSLGGAMATICSGRCFLSHIPANPEQLYTYGSPRVGNNRYVNYVNLDHFRFVNNNDIVTRVPPALLGYRHCGNEVYIDRNGKLGRLGMILKRRDRWWGFIHGLRRRKIDHFSDHSIHEYIAAIHRAVEAEQQEMVGGGVAKSGSEFACDEREWTVDQAELDLPHLKRRDGDQPSPDTSSDDDTDPHKKSLQG
ncbi:Lipase (class 3) [Novipirellula galeiformis]|uniref:Lipase (Class 3) n=1 Tax=Novipirellula galeiformis TaxID=2528004 RepID=A0A5C6CNU6_9BACT|nr:lipase family protein [Novipirellula galeiformis]TWU26200.1 Lipase (class 3) [Novipirellula galeiformis]